MTSQPTKRFLALLISTSLLASLTVATVASPAAAAKPKCQGKVATIVGTNKADRIVGTSGPDVIAALDGNDKVFGRGGNDTICGGHGRDVFQGGPGDDRLFGGHGRDRLFGGPGEDRLFGGHGRDRLFGGPGDDRFDGGAQWDRCRQLAGDGKRVRCEWPLVRRVGKAFVIAFVDLDGDHQFGPDDVLISRLVDTNRDGLPSRGDTVEMGRYPITKNPKDIGDTRAWGVTRHTVDEVEYRVHHLGVTSTTGGGHYWYFPSPLQPLRSEGYGEYRDVKGTNIGSEVSDFQIRYTHDGVYTDRRSPSRPYSRLEVSRTDPGDDRLIDILAYEGVP